MMEACLRRTATLLIAATLASVTSFGSVVGPLAAQVLVSWEPQDFETMRRTVIRWSNASLKPVIALTVSVEGFDEDIEKGSVTYLDAEEGGAEGAARDGGPKIASADSYFFREQFTALGDSYRHIRRHYQVFCESRTISTIATTYYRFPPEEPLVPVFREEDATDSGDAPVEHGVLKALCDNALIYAPPR